MNGEEGYSTDDCNIFHVQDFTLSFVASLIS